VKNVLIVEDDKFNIQLLETIFSKLEMDVNIMSTDDGEEALGIIESSNPSVDMLLLDLHLPGMSGREILEEVRKSKDMKELPILIITVDGFDESELREMGANDFMLKPFDVMNFADKVSVYLLP
jgi:CheY-like chemotaxis protein